MDNERRNKAQRHQKLQRCSGMSGCMRKRIKDEKRRKAGGMSGPWGIQWRRKNTGMTRGAVAMNSREANVKELEWPSENLETYGWLAGT